MKRELDEEPEAETRRLRDEIARQRQTRRPPPPPPSVPQPEPQALPPKTRRAAGVTPPFGRQAELAKLIDMLQAACEGDRRLVFLCGEAGIGKTTLVNAVVTAAQERGMRAAYGQCIDLRGAGEAYLPILDAVSTLCRQSREFMAAMQACAPSWLAQLPALAPAGAVAAPPATTPERMLREMVEALEQATAAEPLLLVLEDLNWSDRSTLDLLSALAYRREAARLRILATYRAADAASSGHPVHALARTLRFRGLAEEIELGPLDEAAVEACLSKRFPGAPPPQGLARILCERSGGNPLFTLDLLELWLAKSAVEVVDDALRVPGGDLEALKAGVPANLSFTIDQQLDRLSEDACLALEAGSVAGPQFSAAVVAAALDRPEDAVERDLADLARRDIFLRETGTCDWPDGTLSSCFGFRHQLYREGLYERLPAGRRMRLHRRIGERLEAAYAGAEAPPATEMAMHFLNGRDPGRAVHYLNLAARQAMRRSAHGDAVDLLHQALELLPVLDEPERDRMELSLRSALGPALIATDGWAAPEAEATYRRAWELADALGDMRRLSSAMFGLATLLEFRARFSETQDILARRMHLLRRLPAGPDGPATVESEELMACSKFHHGSFRLAVEHADRGLAAYDPERDREISAFIGDNPAVACLHWGARALWFLGRADEALSRARRGLSLAEEEGYTFARAMAHEQVARLHQHRREAEATLEHALRAVTLGEEYGFAYRMVTGLILRGWARAVLGDPAAGLADIEDGLANADRIGALLERPYFLALAAEAQHSAGRDGEAEQTLAEALEGARRSEGYFYECEILRLKGMMRLARDSQDSTGEAEAALQEALEIGRRREDALATLRAGMGLVGLWWRQGRAEPARALLDDLDGLLVGGEDLPEMREYAELKRQVAA